MEIKNIKISHYKNIKDISGSDIDLVNFISGIKSGEWQDCVLKVRTTKTEEEKKQEKTKCPAVTISGSFEKRKDSDIRKHSGFIAIDLDHIENPNTTKEILAKDPYVYCSFISISGKGLCLLVRIDPSRHDDAFNGIAAYLYNTYQLIVDRSGSNVSRARFVSYDPYLHINEDALLFKKYLPKEKVKKVNKVVFVKSDFDRIVTEMYDRGINICEDYRDWISCAYAIISEFGESGLNYFQTLSSMSSKYNSSDTEKQYDSCLKHYDDSKVKVSTIGSIYHHAKMNGITLYSQETKEIIRAASSQTKSGVSKESISAGLKKYNGIDEEVSLPIIEQVVKNGISHESENIIEDIISFLRPYDLKKNVLTRNIELNYKPIDDTDINSLFIDCKSMFPNVTKDLICSVIFSNKIDPYNPILDFYKECTDDITDYPNLHLLIQSIVTDTPHHDVWVTKWLISLIASSYGKHSPLMLVLVGDKQGTGKTHWFRYLLPQKLQPLFAESKMDNGKDDEILMTKKWIILDDEFGGKSKREEKKLKEITSKQWINVREPYGRVSVDLRRLAVFCGTSNDKQILKDPTGNRRILPINVLDIDKEIYNLCDKSQLLHELQSIYKSGYDWSILDEEIEILSESTDEFTASGIEEELIYQKLSKGTPQIGEWMTITMIIQHLISDTKINTLSNTKIGMILSKMNYEKKKQRIDGMPNNVYFVNKSGHMLNEV